MSNQKFEITNPEAIKLISDLKSGQLLNPVRSQLLKYRWFLIGFFTLLTFFIAISLGKGFSRSVTPVYIPPAIEEVTPTKSTRVRSSFDGLKTSIVNFSPNLPEPAIPLVDNQISLEQYLLE